MRALVFTAPGRVELAELAEPASGEGEVVVEVRRAGICGSDLHGVRSPGMRVPPLVLGHEIAGVLGDGRRVVVNPLLSCGSCPVCRAGQPQRCLERQLIGVHRAGGLAERVAVPRSSLHEVPGSLGWEAAGLVEPLANAVHALSLVGALRGAELAIVGCGAIGLCCLGAARAGGAGRVVAVDRAADRRTLAARLGADLTGPELEGTYDLVVDAVGSPVTRSLGLSHLARGGKALWIGLESPEPGFDANALVRDELSVLGSFGYRPEDFAEALVLAGKVDTSWAHTVPLAEGAEVFDRLLAGASDPVKALVAP